jgi:hypothetical protein
MGSFISDNREELSKNHYIRKAGAENYWFDFSYNKLEEYRSKFGNQFCLIIFGSEIGDDAYIMPYYSVRDLFNNDLLDNRQRWIGSIRNDIICLPRGNSMSVSGFYNRFDLLDKDVSNETKRMEEKAAIYKTGDIIDKSAVKKKIDEFNKKYKDTKPIERQTISNQVARPGPITDYLKELNNYTCQICGIQGFVQANGNQYVEAHHIIELHKLIPGSYCSDNIIVVCPTCHRKLHYAKVSYSSISQNKIEVSINNDKFKFSRSLLTSELD